MKKLDLIVHNVRSAHNVGSLLRTAEGLGVNRVYLTGYTPYPLKTKDQRLPHIASKTDHQIRKTALGAESLIKWFQQKDIFLLLDKLKSEGYVIAALEIGDNANDVRHFSPDGKTALIVGSEIGGIEQKILEVADVQLAIPMAGRKESFNVAVAAAIALYQLSSIA